jgi:5'-3' exoribonuclease 1
MGIPSYFSHIVKQHRSIIRNFIKEKDKIDNLYLDSNSIIYDAFNNNNNLDESQLINAVCDKLIYYIKLIQPSKQVFIAFDGIAPLAKLNQQRNRRYMSILQKQLADENDDIKNINDTKSKWNTSAITPGTDFMKQLGISINKRFSNNAKEFGLEKIKISNADEEGEGEHKIFEYIRENDLYHKNTKTIIYGLDADLIMLTLNHLHISSQLYLFRETPHFIQQIDRTLNPNELYLLDINVFGDSIIKEFTGNEDINHTTNNENKIFDYIFMCFFLGNDFLPHFPALNIRTNGINYLMNAYKHVFKMSENLTADKGTRIIWKNVRKFIEYLSMNELKYIQDEYKKRDRAYSNNSNSNNTDHKEDYMLIPSKDRSIEKYINPFEIGWEKRYYNTLLFDNDKNDKNDKCKEISINYLQGLEWTMKYYTSGCIDWRWNYAYHYPPLLSDLIKYVPYFDTCLIEKKPKNPVLPLVQLCYVLPELSLDLLPQKLRKELIKHHPEWYTIDCDLKWSFCKYLWEAHACLPPIDINELEKLVISYLESNK